MASQRGSCVLMLVIAAMGVLLLAGSAEAWCKDPYKCPKYPHTTPTCYHGKCGYKCEHGWYDCNHHKHDGCECKGKCDHGKCYGDWKGCKHPYDCPKYPYTTPTCYHGKCGYKCEHGWYDCNNKKHDGCECKGKCERGKCYGDWKGWKGCKHPHECPKYPHTTPTCYHGKCDYKCEHGWYDCNKYKKDGCECKGKCKGKRCY